MLGITCGCSLGREEEGNSWSAEAALVCRAAGAVRRSTSRSRRCMEVEDLRQEHKQALVSRKILCHG